MLVSIDTAIFWNTTSYSLVGRHQHSEATCCFHLQDHIIPSIFISICLPSRWRQQVQPKFGTNSSNYGTLHYKILTLWIMNKTSNLWGLVLIVSTIILNKSKHFVHTTYLYTPTNLSITGHSFPTAVIFNLFCWRTTRFNFSSSFYPQSSWCIIQVIHSL
jgi:hypothetical protein